jgi:hypothetical protein
MTVYEDRGLAEDGHWTSEIRAADLSSTCREAPYPGCAFSRSVQIVGRPSLASKVRFARDQLCLAELPA